MRTLAQPTVDTLVLVDERVRDAKLIDNLLDALDRLYDQTTTALDLQALLTATSAETCSSSQAQ